MEVSNEYLRFQGKYICKLVYNDYLYKDPKIKPSGWFPIYKIFNDLKRRCFLISDNRIKSWIKFNLRGYISNLKFEI